MQLKSFLICILFRLIGIDFGFIVAFYVGRLSEFTISKRNERKVNITQGSNLIEMISFSNAWQYFFQQSRTNKLATHQNQQ